MSLNPNKRPMSNRTEIIVAFISVAALVLSILSLNQSDRANDLSEVANSLDETGVSLANAANSLAGNLLDETQRSNEINLDALAKQAEAIERTITNLVSFGEGSWSIMERIREKSDQNSDVVLLNLSAQNISHVWVEGKKDEEEAYILIWTVPPCDGYTFPADFKPMKVHFYDSIFQNLWIKDLSGKTEKIPDIDGIKALENMPKKDHGSSKVLPRICN